MIHSIFQFLSQPKGLFVDLRKRWGWSFSAINHAQLFVDAISGKTRENPMFPNGSRAFSNKHRKQISTPNWVTFALNTLLIV